MASYKKHSTGWEYRLKYTDPFTKKVREKSERGFRVKPEAELAAAEFLRKLKEGSEQSDLPLSDYLDHWIENYQKGVKRKNTAALHELNVKNHIKPYFKKLMLRELKPDMYQKFLDHCLSKGLSRRTVEIIHTTVNSAMSRALIQGKIDRNPCVGAINKGIKRKREVQFIESSDVPHFLQAAHNYGYIYWIFFRLLIGTGLRKGEAGALQWSDIDFKNLSIRINKTLDFKAKINEAMFGDTKTMHSERIVKISEGLASDLRFHLAWQNQNKLNSGDLYYHKLNLVLCRPDGSPMRNSSLFNAFERILIRAKLPALPIHALRHTRAVLMLEAGADMKYVQEQLGHGSIQITSDVYSHISKKLEAKNTDKIDAYVDGLTQKTGGISGAD
ncbi:site-specific integrase [Paenibacillus lycopersici]|uniref:Site-specific integrase n=1 Tax=Paenibacillus lycopersici TaxID=2704462 RepID=A0A6C0FX83_9BACL|nr:tyrosine-type recombinase/integrase [Paenibacillus lycopersici]QHT61736.1 site-specific integrase [Paenibacillus lycopersici]